MKLIAIAAALVALAPISAHAIMLTDTEYPFVKLSASGDNSHTVVHDLSAYIPGAYQAVSGTLYLAFADDSQSDGSEWARILFSTSSFSEEIGGSIWSYDWEDFGLNAAARADLNQDGRLSVTVKAKEGDFWWKRSVLTVDARPVNGPPVSVPEPGTLILLGAGLVAIAFGSRRRRARQA